MALKRETKSVAIGSMPYVRPANLLGGVARDMQQEGIRRQNVIDQQEENTQVAEQTAIYFNGLERIRSEQARPDPAAAAKEVAVLQKQVLNNKNTNSVNRRLQASFEGITSSFFNGLSKQATELETRENIDALKARIDLEVDVAQRMSNDSELDIGYFQSRINEHAKDLLVAARGKLTPTQVDEIKRQSFFELNAKSIATRFAKMQEEGDAKGAQEYLTRAIDGFGKNLQEERSFRNIIVETLRDEGLSDSIKKARLTEYDRYSKLTTEEKLQYLSTNGDTMNPAELETYQNLLIAEQEYIAGIPLDENLVKLNTLNTVAEIDSTGRLLLDKFPGKRNIAKITAGIKSAKSRLVTAQATAAAKELTARQRIAGMVDFDAVYDNANDNGVLLSNEQIKYIQGTNTPRTPDQIRRLIKINSHNTKMNNEVTARIAETSPVPLQNDDDIAKFIDKTFDYNAGQQLKNYLEDDSVEENPQMIEMLAKEINRVNYIPKGVRDLFTKNVLSMSSAQIKKVAGIYTFIDQYNGKHIQSNVIDVTQSVSADMKQMFKIARTGTIAEIDAFKSATIAAKGSATDNSVSQRTKEVLDNPDAIPQALFATSGENSYIGRQFDLVWNQVLGSTLSVSPIVSGFIKITKPSAQTEAFTSWATGGFQGLISGYDVDDFTSQMNKQTRELYEISLTQVLAEMPNLADDEAAAYALQKMANTTTPSVFMAVEDERSQEDDRNSIYQLHAFSPEAMLMNPKLPAEKRMTGDEVSIAMIETARTALIANIEKSGLTQDQYLDRRFGITKDSPDSVLFTKRAENGTLTLDMGVLMLSGRLAFKNGRKNRQGQMEYEIHIAKPSPTRDDKYVWAPIMVPGDQSTSMHFPIGKNIEALRQRSFHSDFKTMEAFVLKPSLLAPAAYYKGKNILEKGVDAVMSAFGADSDR